MTKRNDGIVEIHGKEYKTVGLRVGEIRKDHPTVGISTKLIEDNGDVIIMKSVITLDGVVLGVGHAEEIRGSTNINKTSALENAETSAVGRALAFAGYGGTEIASAEEVATAIQQQAEMEQVERLYNHNNAVRDHLPSIMVIKECILGDNWSEAYEAWHEIPDEDKAKLWIAPSKGGVFTTAERAAMKSDEWNDAKKDYFGEVE